MSRGITLAFAIAVFLTVPSCKDVKRMEQRIGGTTTVIAEGGTTTAATVNLLVEADIDSTIQAEIRPVGTNFTGTATHTGTAVQAASGGRYVANIPAVLTSGQYHWQARVIPADGSAPGNWDEFGSNGNTDLVVNATTPGPGPGPTPLTVTISGMTQEDLSTSNAIPEGGTIATTFVRFGIDASCSQGNLQGVDIEVRPIATAFSTPVNTQPAGTPGFSGTWNLSYTAGSYKWRARATHETGATSGWVEFGTTGNTDFIIGSAPTVTLTLAQMETSSLTAISEGATITTDKVRMAAQLATTTGTLSELAIEARLAGEPFTGDPTSKYALSGTTMAWFADLTLANGAWHWRAKLFNSAGQDSGWLEFGSTGNADFVVNADVPVPEPEPAPRGTPDPLSTARGHSGGRCGLLGAEALLAFAALALLRRKS